MGISILGKKKRKGKEPQPPTEQVMDVPAIGELLGVLDYGGDRLHADLRTVQDRTRVAYNDWTHPVADDGELRRKVASIPIVERLEENLLSIKTLVSEFKNANVPPLERMDHNNKFALMINTQLNLFKQQKRLLDLILPPLRAGDLATFAVGGENQVEQFTILVKDPSNKDGGGELDKGFFKSLDEYEVD